MKKRIIKEHDVRRREILNTAKEMFYSMGYEKSSVEKLILKIGIAKGTFYHYFKSKSDLLNELVKQEITPVLEKIKSIKTQTELNALEKFNRIIASLNNWKIDNLELYKIMLKQMYCEENLKFRHKILELQLELFTPHYAEIIEEGIGEEIFDNDEPQGTAELLIMTGDLLKQRIGKAYSEVHSEADLKEVLLKHIQTYEKLINRIIGVKKGEIKLIDPDILSRKNNFK